MTIIWNAEAAAVHLKHTVAPDGTIVPPTKDLAHTAPLDHFAESHRDEWLKRMLPATDGQAFVANVPDWMIDLRWSDQGLTTLHADVGNLRSLTSLDVSNNLLHGLPDEIGELIELQALDCSKNALRDLPSSVGRLVALETLDASRNLLTRLPSTICALSALTTLLVSQNKLRQLPDKFGTPVIPPESAADRAARLEAAARPAPGASTRAANGAPFYGICGNVQREVDELRAAIQEVQAPRAVKRLAELTRLDVSDNFLEELPPAILKCTALRSLDLHRNRIANLPALDALYCCTSASDSTAHLTRARAHRPASHAPPSLVRAFAHARCCASEHRGPARPCARLGCTRCFRMLPHAGS
jgi:hypothetical protein